MNDHELIEILRRAAEAQRPWANFFWWHDRSPEGKSVAECGAARELVESLRAARIAAYGDPRPSGDTWPDCVTEREDGESVAIEVTELIEAETLRGGTPKPWTNSRLADAIQERVSAKDARAFHGQQYTEVLLLIHTDELYLTPSHVLPTVRETTFHLPHGNITRAFILLSYWPELGRCPAAELHVSR